MGLFRGLFGLSPKITIEAIRREVGVVESSSIIDLDSYGRNSVARSAVVSTVVHYIKARIHIRVLLGLGIRRHSRALDSSRMPLTSSPDLSNC